MEGSTGGDFDSIAENLCAQLEMMEDSNDVDDDSLISKHCSNDSDQQPTPVTNKAYHTVEENDDICNISDDDDESHAKEDERVERERAMQNCSADTPRCITDNVNPFSFPSTNMQCIDNSSMQEGASDDSIPTSSKIASNTGRKRQKPDDDQREEAAPRVNKRSRYSNSSAEDDSNSLPTTTNAPTSTRPYPQMYIFKGILDTSPDVNCDFFNKNSGNIAQLKKNLLGKAAALRSDGENYHIICVERNGVTIKEMALLINHSNFS